MDIGIGLPAPIPGIHGGLIVEWARRAEAGSFSTVSLIDRVVYSNHESLITLAAVAGATQRVRLMTSVLLAPVHNATMLAKQTATLDSISGGRLVLGLGVGGRQDDFRAVGGTLRGRGRQLEEHLALMRRVWSGEAVAEGVGPIGPPPARPGGPEVLLGGYAPAALRRVGRWADGFIASPQDAKSSREKYDVALESWREAGRSGRPRFVGCFYYTLGSEATVERGRTYLLDYYAFAGERAQAVASGMLSSAEQIRDTLKACEEVGMDEVALWATVPELDQVDRLQEAVS